MLVIFLDRVSQSFMSYDEINKLQKIDKRNDYILTNDLTWFQFWNLEDFGDIILVRVKTNEYISLRDLLENNGSGYTEKYIPETHDVLKVFLANGFRMKTDAIENINIIKEKLGA